MGINESQTIVEALVRARADLAKRLGVEEVEILEGAVEQTEFPDAALGVPLSDEMSAQVITPGWRIRLEAQGRPYEYRAAGKQVRLYNFNGKNYKL
ncbi:MAG TPA: hypothetical protein VIU65_09345 [Pyrinomonadaceae bacterium]